MLSFSEHESGRIKAGPPTLDQLQAHKKSQRIFLGVISLLPAAVAAIQAASLFSGELWAALALTPGLLLALAVTTFFMQGDAFEDATADDLIELDKFYNQTPEGLAYYHAVQAQGRKFTRYEIRMIKSWTWEHWALTARLVVRPTAS